MRTYLSRTKDTDGHEYRVEKSSAVAVGDKEGRFVWLFTDQVLKEQHLGRDQHAALHLDVAAAANLACALAAFCDDRGVTEQTCVADCAGMYDDTLKPQDPSP